VKTTQVMPPLLISGAKGMRFRKVSARQGCVRGMSWAARKGSWAGKPKRWHWTGGKREGAERAAPTSVGHGGMRTGKRAGLGHQAGGQGSGNALAGGTSTKILQGNAFPFSNGFTPMGSPESSARLADTHVPLGTGPRLRAPETPRACLQIRVRPDILEVGRAGGGQ